MTELLGSAESKCLREVARIDDRPDKQAAKTINKLDAKQHSGFLVAATVQEKARK